MDATKDDETDDGAASRYSPLLQSIATEIQERTLAVVRLERELEALRTLSFDPEAELRLIAEAATHRRELRMTLMELDRLGCSIVGTQPLTFRIPIKSQSQKRSVLWQALRW